LVARSQPMSKGGARRVEERGEDGVHEARWKGDEAIETVHSSLRTSHTSPKTSHPASNPPSNATPPRP
jgi:hypothetical protein